MQPSPPFSFHSLPSVRGKGYNFVASNDYQHHLNHQISQGLYGREIRAMDRNLRSRTIAFVAGSQPATVGKQLESIALQDIVTSLPVSSLLYNILILTSFTVHSSPSDRP